MTDPLTKRKPTDPLAPQGPQAPPPNTGVFTGVDPSSSMSVQQAQTQLETQIGRPLSQDEQTEAMGIAQKAGWDGTSPLSGAAYNAVSQEAARRTPGGTFEAWNPTPTAAAPPAEGQEAVSQNVWQTLNDLIKRVPTYDPNAPQNKMQLDVARVNHQRSAERKRAAMAERDAAMGTSHSGGQDVDIERILNEQGMDDASFEAALARDSINADRGERMQALGIGAGLTGQAEGDKVRMQLANLDAALRREGLSLQEMLGTGQLGNNLLGILLGTQLGNDRLAYDYTNLERLINEGVMDAALGR